MDYNDFIVSLWEKVGTCPKNWRKGQKVFNTIEELYGDVARKVQFEKGIDCFYDDEKIDSFINASWELISKK